MKIIHGDCLEKLKELPENSIDSIVTDPPYGLSFMGKKWDYDVPSEEVWKECLRVLKPGGYLLAFAGTRTQHRMAVRIEDAGFEIRDMIAWIYGSGFPKSLNIGKAVDKLQGNERKVVGEKRTPDGKLMSARTPNSKDGYHPSHNVMSGATKHNIWQDKGTSEWEGWGTALKPAHEPITVARKPIEGTVAENCLKWGVGGLNIDGSRVGTEGGETHVGGFQNEMVGGEAVKKVEKDLTPRGRWPANLIHDGSDEVVELFPSHKPHKMVRNRTDGARHFNNNGEDTGYETVGSIDDPGGSAARFFYCAKASKKDRDEGLDCTRTVKYNGSINPNKELCKEENMVAVQLLQRVISEPELVSFSIGESGVNIMAQCQSGSLSTIKTTISKIIESKILNLLTLSLTSGFTEDASLEKMSGGSHAESVGSLKKWLLTITNGQSALALGASDVALKMLLQIRNEENWNQSRNIHSTVKPTALMRYLVKLVTPPGGTVLDPFTGSGSTGKACKLEGFEFIGIEREEEYVKIAEARIAAVTHQPTLV